MLGHDELEKLAATIEAAPVPVLLTPRQTKIQKGEKYGYLTTILHLSPARLAGFEVCASRSAGCTAACLNTAGRAKTISGKGIEIHIARIRKTKWFKADREAFMDKLEREIAGHIRRAKKLGMKPAVRLNGTSDIPWENVRFGENRRTLFDSFPTVQFYDYTKHAIRMGRPMPANYDLTFSANEDNEAGVQYALGQGARVAIVFRNAANPHSVKWALPETYEGRRVVDADQHDLRFLEPAGVWCGLRAKGSAQDDSSGFARNVWVFPPNAFSDIRESEGVIA